jgi:soluble lytic murein transglycosylase-like protein
MESNTTTTESTNEETSNDSVTSQVETTTTDTSSGSEETSETTTTEQPSIESLQAQIKRIETALKKANTEAKNYRLEANELKQFKAQVEAEKLTEQEKQELARKNLESQLATLQKQHEDAVREKQELRIEHAVSIQAQKLGFADPDDAKRFLDMAALEFDDNGAPTNVTDLLGDVLKIKPYLKAQTGRATVTSGGATNPPRSVAATNKEISWELISQLKPEEYAARRSEIQQWMSDSKNYRR